MILSRLVEAMGWMTLSYLIHCVSRSIAESLAQSNRPKIFIYFFLFIQYFSALCSLFVGLAFSFQDEEIKSLRESKCRLAQNFAESSSKVSELSAEVDSLRVQLRNESIRTNEKSYEKGMRAGYVNGYAVGFEDCAYYFSVDSISRHNLKWMARHSGVHRLKSRPNFLSETDPVEKNGILT